MGEALPAAAAARWRAAAAQTAAGAGAAAEGRRGGASHTWLQLLHAAAPAAAGRQAATAAAAAEELGFGLSVHFVFRGRSPSRGITQPLSWHSAIVAENLSRRDVRAEVETLRGDPPKLSRVFARNSETRAEWAFSMMTTMMTTSPSIQERCSKRRTWSRRFHLGLQ